MICNFIIIWCCVDNTALVRAGKLGNYLWGRVFPYCHRKKPESFIYFLAKRDNFWNNCVNCPKPSSINSGNLASIPKRILKSDKLPSVCFFECKLNFFRDLWRNLFYSFCFFWKKFLGLALTWFTFSPVFLIFKFNVPQVLFFRGSHLQGNFIVKSNSLGISKYFGSFWTFNNLVSSRKTQNWNSWKKLVGLVGSWSLIVNPDLMYFEKIIFSYDSFLLRKF